MNNNPSSPFGNKNNDVALTVLKQPLESNQAKPHSKMGRRRAAVLIFVHILIVAHIVFWIRTGSTVSPVEPSEAMQTLEYGEVNAGFIFFVAAILATLIFGRFFCGWGCHLVALQDLCTWIMNKCGVRPKPFRSRLLVWAPLAFGFYMFVWPSFKRLALFPLLQLAGLEPPIWLGAVPEFHGFSSGIIVEDFWATFPPWYVAVPFFGVVGFAAVYFLGSKGFCTYGCPYGGIFGVADQLSPGRIVVNDNCHQCGHCTAVCTSNVRVAEEIKDFGMVVDPGCMKCMDCVSACPNGALSIGIATPAFFRKPVDQEAHNRREKHKANPKRFDLSWPEEILLAVVFVAMFFAFRGMLNLVPMLMAAGMAGIGTFAAWKLWSLISKPNVRVQSIVLKTKNKLMPQGWIAGVVSVVVVLTSIWSGGVNFGRTMARNAHGQILIPIDLVLRDEFVPTNETLEIAERGRHAYAFTDSLSGNGYGWALNAENKREFAYLQLICGNPVKAETLLKEIVDGGNPTAQLVQQLASLMTKRGASADDVLAELLHAYQDHEDMESLAPTIAMRLAKSDNNDAQKAFGFWDSQIEAADYNAFVCYQAAEFAIAVRQTDRAAEYMQKSVPIQPDDVQSMIVKARVLAKLGESETAIEALLSSESSAHDNPFELATIVSLLAALGADDQAAELSGRSLAVHSNSLPLLQADVVLAIGQGDLDRAKSRCNSIVAAAESDPWRLLSVGESIVRNGLIARNQELARIGIDSMHEALRLKPDSPLIKHDLGQALLAIGDVEAGLQMLKEASAMAPRNMALATALVDANKRLDD
jgi:tetratricopeptide (TPR) repeat protein/ferredoxin